MSKVNAKDMLRTNSLDLRKPSNPHDPFVNKHKQYV